MTWTIHHDDESIDCTNLRDVDGISHASTNRGGHGEDVDWCRS